MVQNGPRNLIFITHERINEELNSMGYQGFFYVGNLSTWKFRDRCFTLCVIHKHRNQNCFLAYFFLIDILTFYEHWSFNDHKLESRWYHSNGRKWIGIKKPLDEGEREEWKADLKLIFQKTKSWHLVPSLHGK